MELPKKAPVRSYKTDFRKNESPLSEGGLWLNGRKDGIDWCDVLVKNGEDFGEVSRTKVKEQRAEQAALGHLVARDLAEGDAVFHEDIAPVDSVLASVEPQPSLGERSLVLLELGLVGTDRRLLRQLHRIFPFALSLSQIGL